MRIKIDIVGQCDLRSSKERRKNTSMNTYSNSFDAVESCYKTNFVGNASSHGTILFRRSTSACRLRIRCVYCAGEAARSRDTRCTHSWFTALYHQSVFAGDRFVRIRDRSAHAHTGHGVLFVSVPSLAGERNMF